jgi:ribosomal protein L34E
MNPSVKRFKLRLQDAEKKFIKKHDETSAAAAVMGSPRKKGYEQPIGCVSCPKCLKKMMKVDGIDKVMKITGR